MPDYINYTFDDFIQDPRFRQWALTNAPAEQAFWNDWLQIHPEKLDLVLTARQFVMQLHQAQDELTDNELDTELRRLVLARQQLPAEAISTVRPRFLNWAWTAAAAVLIGVGVWLYVGRQVVRTPLAAFQQVVQRHAGSLQEVRNENQASQLVRLPDGSQVTLHPGSHISFPARFSIRQRAVFLTGEAFFEVVRRPKQPFMVYTNLLTTKVLGTSFTVRAYEGEREANVVVRTGKVSVFTTPVSGTPGPAEASEPAFILTPNQQVTFNREDRQMTRSLVAAPKPIVVPSGQAQTLVFEHTPVVSVFKTLEATYGIPINYDADLLKNCELTAELGPETLFEKLELICRATESSYEVIDAQIVIYSKGCRPDSQ